MGAVARGARAVTRSGRSEPLDLTQQIGDAVHLDLGRGAAKSARVGVVGAAVEPTRSSIRRQTSGCAHVHRSGSRLVST